MLGKTISHYKVLEKIGQGGMGEVYRATDTKLNRDVALKILPEQFASDSQRMGRFQREAEVLASLDHPNIGQIYGIEEAGQTKALVLQLIEGPTLAERIDQGPIPVEEALKIALQMAEGLEAAHEKGVIHRDLKPANVKITPEGQVKILDFGLAKALESEVPGSSLSQSPTLTNAATQAGVILGTAAYMSPEQAKGKVVDKRADVWAFGCVLYEMLTGQRAFAGGDVSDTMAAVLRLEADWEALPRDVPPVLANFLRRCLHKETKQRIHDVADVRLALEGVFEVDAAQLSADPMAPVAPRPLLWRRALPWFAGIALAAITGLAVWAWLGSAPPLSTKRFTLTLPGSDELPLGSGNMLTVSPDGGTLVYRATRDGVFQLFRRPLDQFEATPMQGTEGGEYPFFSPDGEWVGFWADGALQKVPLAGGPPQRLTAMPNNARGASWGRDDLIVFAPNTPGGSLMQVSAAGGDATALFTPDDQRLTWYPQILPGGDAVLFTLSDATPDSGELHLLILGSGEHRTVVPSAVAGRVLDTGHLVFLRSGTLWAVPFDLDRFEMVGNPVPVVEGVRVEGGGAVQFAIAGDGTLVYIPGEAATAGNRGILWVDRAGQEEPLATPARNYASLVLSPDGRRAALEIEEGGGSDVWVTELARGTLTRITADPGVDGSPLWSPDGRRVVFTSNRSGRLELLWKAADGTGAAETLASFDEAVIVRPSSWSPDGSALAIEVNTPDTGIDVGLVSVDGSGDWEPLIQTAANEYQPVISPDGKWIAYTSDETGERQVYVQRFPDLGERRQISVVLGHRPTWSPDGSELIYLGGRPSNAVMGVTVQDDAAAGGTVVGTAELLLDFRYFSRAGVHRYYDVSPDGERFLMISSPQTGTDTEESLRKINVVLNWFEELKRVVPIN